ncbi:MAG: VOC family protein [Candidatus Eisenbacteria bacterium]|nr:VOC family protein [Candidatus Eisenbacteria bacterium]
MGGPVTHTIPFVALIVREYDEAIDFFTQVLRFRLVEDRWMAGGKRWVVVAPDAGAGLVLARATSPEQESRIGNQTGGRVFMFLRTEDFWGDYRHLRDSGVRFIEEPREEEYGTVVVFLDLYGNKWDLVQLRGGK